MANSVVGKVVTVVKVARAILGQLTDWLNAGRARGWWSRKNTLPSGDVSQEGPKQ